jgi:hypothetical protein
VNFIHNNPPKNPPDRRPSLVIVIITAVPSPSHTLDEQQHQAVENRRPSCHRQKETNRSGAQVYSDQPCNRWVTRSLSFIRYDRSGVKTLTPLLFRRLRSAANQIAVVGVPPSSFPSPVISLASIRSVHISY